ncbi:MAG: acetylesterase, partial [Verrucomicrobia bacterium]|nr:acetylesterase [Verrucomicrobiota bacterium]
MKSPKVPFAILFVAFFGLAASAPGASNGKSMSIPDFTKGDTIPPKSKHDWNLGPTGLRGWMYCDKMVTSDSRQVKITHVDKGSPADGSIAPGDVLLGVGGRPFSHDPRTEIGMAITAAETELGKGRLTFIRWREGQTNEVIVHLPVLGSFSSTAPYDCKKSSRVLEQGLNVLARRMSTPGYARGLDPIPRSLNALALLAGGNKEHESLVRKEAQWAADFQTDDFKTWYYGYVMIFLAEYISATGDRSVLPGLRRLALASAKGQSAVGSWGHTFAKPDGRLRGYGMMNSPGLPLTIGLVLARETGLKDPEISKAIELSAKLIRFYIGKGSVPYGDHPAWMEGHEDNGKCGMAAVLFKLLQEKAGAEFFMQMALAAHGNERDQGHTGNFFNMLWSLPAIAQGGPQATGAWMQEFGAWYHDLARRWDGTWHHQGPPEPDYDSYKGWSCTGAYLLGYAMPLRKTTLTGKRPSMVQPLTAEATQSLIADGRGWTNKDRTGAYIAMGEAELLKRLGSWSPIVRERAAAALVKLKERPIDAIIALLDSPRLETRLGACSALAHLGGRAAAAVPRLRALLQHPDLWLRVRA